MIITDLTARNLLKYKKLDLHGLPGTGLIGISGENESGKSSVGETICFALFGQSFSLGPDEGKKMLRWGATSGSVKLRFLVRDTAYELSRFLDNDGNHSARLSRDGDEAPVATGIQRVETALTALVGFDYDEYVEAFYLAQREIHAPEAGSNAIKKMAGLAALEHASEELDSEIQAETKASTELNQEILNLEREHADLAIDESLLPRLEQERESLANTGRLAKNLLTETEEAATAYNAGWPKLKSAEARKRFQGFFKFIFLLIALLAGAAWYVLTQMGDSSQAQQLGSLLARVPQWKEDYIQYLHYVAAGAAGLFILTWLFGLGTRSRIRALSENGPRLADKAEALRRFDFDIFPEPAEAVDEEGGEASETTEEDADTETAATPSLQTELHSTTDDAAIERLISRVRRNEATPQEVENFLAEKTDQIEPLLVRVKIEVGKLAGDISEEQERLQLAAKLKQDIELAREKMAQHAERVELRELSGELLALGGRDMSRRFNTEVRDLVGRLLPLFTEGRYEHLQIDDNLNVRVFSTEKKDFLNIEEISSGTQRQIMLAMRLAVSQQLVSSLVKDRQFLFLDEPFAFFDAARTHASLKALPQLSDEITQIWVVAQTFPEDARGDFAALIDCGHEVVELSL